MSYFERRPVLTRLYPPVNHGFLDEKGHGCYNAHIPSCFTYDNDEVNTLNAYEVLNIPPTATRDEIRTAYRAMARRWHPDRFMAGPERDWANEKMAEINGAYRLCLDSLTDARRSVEADDEGLRQIQQMIEAGQYLSARKALMRLNTRCAEWNYLFGWLLMRQSDMEKALIYLSVAAHQKPDCAKYARALQEAQQMDSATNRLSRLLARRR